MVCCKAVTLAPPPSASASLEMPEGTMDPQSTFYVERPSDHTALAAIERQGITISIKAPRQMGKSSYSCVLWMRQHARGSVLLSSIFNYLRKQP